MASSLVVLSLLSVLLYFVEFQCHRIHAQHTNKWAQPPAYWGLHHSLIVSRRWKCCDKICEYRIVDGISTFSKLPLIQHQTNQIVYFGIRHLSIYRYTFVIVLNSARINSYLYHIFPNGLLVPTFSSTYKTLIASKLCVRVH